MGLSTGFILLSIFAVVNAGSIKAEELSITPITAITESAVSTTIESEALTTGEISKIEEKTTEEAIFEEEIIIVDKAKYNIKKEKFIRDKKFEPEVGTATWYGGRFHGRKTASGEIFNKHNFTAAHRKIPLGTMIRVTNERTGESIIVKVNDTCHAAPKRVMIDLSDGAFKKLATKKDDGLMKVKIERLKPFEDEKK
jgi:rare lipoprotein A